MNQLFDNMTISERFKKMFMEIEVDGRQLASIFGDYREMRTIQNFSVTFDLPDNERDILFYEYGSNSTITIEVTNNDDNISTNFNGNIEDGITILKYLENVFGTIHNSRYYRIIKISANRRTDRSRVPTKSARNVV